MIRSLLCPVVVMVVVLGCTDDKRMVDVVTEEATPAPDSRGTLRVDSDHPLSFGTALSLDSRTLVAADRVTNDVWLIDASAEVVRVQRLLRGDERVRAKLVAISRDTQEWRLLDRAGTLYRFNRTSWQFTGSSRITFGRGTIAAAAADSAGGFALLVRRPVAQTGGALEYALLVVDPFGTARESWSALPPARTGRGSGSDMISLTRNEHGWLASGSSPPRALHFDASGTLLRTNEFVTTPGRAVSEEVVAQFQRTAAAAGFHGRIQAPSHYPAITALRQVGAAYVAVPLVGGSTGEAEGLDVYCNGHYTRTIFDSPSIVQVLLTEHGVIILSETAAASYTIEYYRMAALPLTCEDAT